tara:strand:- start:2167 stop:2553 length:387 start_codon:yes stop_codon:yes gene_type:complete
MWNLNLRTKFLATKGNTMVKIQVPTSIKIGYRDYKLEEWKQTVATANEAQGQFFQKEGIIGYVVTEEGVSHANTILHEVLHAIIYQWNIDLEEKEEEKLVNGLANGLTTVFVDNPELMDYLKTKIKEG